MKEITDYEEIKMERIKIKNEISKKSKELSDLNDKYSDLETIIRVKDKGRLE
jgi:hypothetical protein